MRGDNIVTSSDALFSGWMIIFIKNPAYVSWFANPILFISWMNYVLSGKRALEYSIAATGFAIFIFVFQGNYYKMKVEFQWRLQVMASDIFFGYLLYYYGYWMHYQ